MALTFASSTTRTFSPTESVIEEVAAREGVDPIDLEIPLFESIDPEALDKIVQSAIDDPDRSPIEIEFTYADYDVTVSSADSGTVTVR